MVVSQRMCVWCWCSLVACGPQVTLPDEQGSSDSSGPIGSGLSPTTSATTATSTTTSGTSTSTTEPSSTVTSATSTTGIDPDSTGPVEPASSSEDEGCGEGECRVDADCPGGGSCIACICFGECVPSDGVFGDCLLPDGTTDIMACGDAAALCIVDNAAMPSFGMCASPCDEACECPAPPAPEFAEQIVCDDITGDGIGDCYIECGEECPPGMICSEAAICVFGAG